ncbi:MAG: sulfotransferase domain-containing protein [Solirubrobacterales bacterium]
MRNLDFLVIGAPQSGTTSLWRGFEAHPQIRVPSDKERGFFNSDKRFERGLEPYLSWTFGDAGEKEALGTVTPQLMMGDSDELDRLVDRIAKTCPDIRLIAILRNPIDRSVSNFRRSRRIRDWPDENFDAATRRLAGENGGLENVPFIRDSEYGRILNRYLAVFDREQIQILYLGPRHASRAGISRGVRVPQT